MIRYDFNNLEPKYLQVFNSFVEYNEWLRQLSNDQKSLILHLMNETYGVGYDDGYNESWDIIAIK